MNGDEGAASAEIDALLALDMEYRLTIAHRIGCECALYFAGRREVLIPEVLRLATERGEDPVDLFADFARKVHLNRCKTVTTGRIAALFALIADELDPATSPDLSDGGDPS